MTFETGSILLVEDDDVEAILVTRSLRRLGLDMPIHVVCDGQAALDHLRAEAEPDEARPYVVLLDINMPGMNGHEFLGELRRDPRLRRATVFMFTTSDNPVDIERAYDRGVAGYIVKSDLGTDYAELGALLHQLGRIVRPPDTTMVVPPSAGSGRRS